MKRYNATGGVIERTDGFWVSYDAVQEEIENLRQRVAELEDKAANMERLKFIWQNKAVERGERMKWLRYELIEAVAVSRGNATDKWKESNDWFDPEGAPL